MVKLKILKNLKQIRSNLINFEIILSKTYTKILYLNMEELEENLRKLLETIDEIRFLILDAHKQAKFFLKQQRYKHKKEQKEVDYEKLDFLKRLEIVEEAIREANTEAAYRVLTKKQLKKQLEIPDNYWRAFAPLVYERLREKGAKIDGNWIIIPKGSG